MRRYNANTWADMEKNVISACEKISCKIKNVENKQMRNMQELDRFVEQKSRKVNEAASPEMNTLLAMIL